MTLFLLTFLLLYGGMHTYALLRLRLLYPAGRGAFAWMVLMTSAPLLVRLAEVTNHEDAALWLAWPGYIWMGFIFIFVSFMAAGDITRFAAAKLLHTGISPKICCQLALTAALAASGWSLYEARQIRTDQVTVTTPRLPIGAAPIRIVQISDVHIGLLFRETRLAAVLQAVRSAVPDILVSTGDLVDGRLSREEVVDRSSRLAGMLAALPAPLGKFAVTGNHEFYAGIEQAAAFTRQAGFRVLRNETASLPAGISIMGVDDPGRGTAGKERAAVQEQTLLARRPAGFRLLLKHRPVVSPDSDGRFDLQLSGHTHRGQLLPFYPLTWLEFSVHSGTSRTERGSLVHVSRGSGTWGPPMRLLAPPEVTVIDIVPESGAGSQGRGFSRK